MLHAAGSPPGLHITPWSLGVGAWSCPSIGVAIEDAVSLSRGPASRHGVANATIHNKIGTKISCGRC